MVDQNDHDQHDKGGSPIDERSPADAAGSVEGRDPRDVTEDRSTEVEADEDEETWTNQPSAHAAHTGDLPADEEDLEDDEEDEAEQQPAARKAIQNGRDVVCDELPFRASRAKQRLRPYLTGTLVIELTNLGERYLFDWRGEEPKVSPVEGAISLAQGESSDASKVDCIISISEPNLMAVRSGDLNPQLAMLADKIKVQGRVSPAVYLFNLVAPRERS